MTATDVLLRERAALCDTMEKVGPDAPTLCEGWLTIDLAAHLCAREARSDAAIGIVLGGPFERHLQNVMAKYKERGYEPMIGEGELTLAADTPAVFDPWGKLLLRAR